MGGRKVFPKSQQRYTHGDKGETSYFFSLSVNSGEKDMRKFFQMWNYLP